MAGKLKLLTLARARSFHGSNSRTKRSGRDQVRACGASYLDPSGSHARNAARRQFGPVTLSDKGKVYVFFRRPSVRSRGSKPHT